MIHGVELIEPGCADVAVWAPGARRVEIELTHATSALAALDGGWHTGRVAASAGDRYWLQVDGERLADPASRWQPDGVHGPSAVADDRRLHDAATGAGAWRPPPLDEWVISEIHIGTFTGEGTFDAAAARLADLVRAGITAVELMPIAEFPGARNWGYDGVFPSAVQSSYGGPAALARFVAAAHRAGLAVVLDVVYNHLGPEGNVLARLGSYFTDGYRTPWGEALNFDGRGSDEVRGFFIQSACRWVRTFAVDGLRLDAVHAIVDPSARPFIAELSDAVHAAGDERGQPAIVIAESAANDPRVITPTAELGLGCDSVWDDDFHHALHVALTGEQQEYYRDYCGVADLAEAMEHGFVLRGRASPFRGRRHGAAPRRGPGRRFVVFAQNHDHIGNRPAGDRLAASLPGAALDVAAAAVALSPYVPLLFQGEEWGSRTPFPYFTSHTDLALAGAVSEGRAREFAGFFGARGDDAADQAGGDGDRADVPDPQAEATFAMARLDWSERARDEHPLRLAWWQSLLALRRTHPALRTLDQCGTRATALADGHVLALERRAGAAAVVALLSFATQPVTIELATAPGWTTLLASSGVTAGGASGLTLPPHGVMVVGTPVAGGSPP